VRYWILTVVAAALIGGGVFTAALSIKEVTEVGSCGGNQVVINDRYSDEPCPEGIGTLIGLSVGGIFASIIGIFAFVLRGGGSRRRVRRGGSGAAGVSGQSVGARDTALGTSALGAPAYTPPQPRPPPRTPSPPGPAPASGPAPTSSPAPTSPSAPALPTMPSVPPVQGYTPPPAGEEAAAPAAPAAGDPVERLARLDKLREQGVLSEAEFAAAKARLLGDL